MAYLENSVQTSNKAAAVAGVVVIHACLGYVVITGLSNVIQLIAPPPPLVGETVIDLPPPPQPKDPKPDAVTPKPAADQRVVTPRPDIEITPVPANFGTSDLLNDIENDIIIEIPPHDPLGTGTGGVQIPKFDPISARPKNNPSAWVTQSDYRSVWVNREYSGLARFKLTVGTSGKVENCQITASTGYTALDQATCKLVQKRARFDAARNSSGERTAGTYSSAVQWVLPD